MDSPSASPPGAKDGQPSPINMSFDEFFASLPHASKGTIFMATPSGADLSAFRLVSRTLLPNGIEITVDDEVIFLCGHPDDFDSAAFCSLSEIQQQDVLEAMMRYHVVKRGFLSIYRCRLYRLWAERKSLMTEN